MREGTNMVVRNDANDDQGRLIGTLHHVRHAAPFVNPSVPSTSYGRLAKSVSSWH